MSSSIRIVGVFLLAAAILAVALWIYRAGGQGVSNSIERQNNEAARRADESALDYDACRDAGRVWDFRTGKCGRSAPSGRN
ncbi:hypothetical protein JNB91_23710 [Rhizobium wenxiniae]|uniref:hypothetical protein n=1 Tax=Rhizobium wenxiniae TaxID=1737357 RepID=UPI001C6F3A73|nr:hypothetical protein [Rhizobium wenxiniae]MBW9090822.1 hypothetical protein [Rhizobium wenxiniae]